MDTWQAGNLDDFVNIAHYAFVFVLEVDVSEEITCKRQNHSFVQQICPQVVYIKHSKQQN